VYCSSLMPTAIQVRETEVNKLQLKIVSQQALALQIAGRLQNIKTYFNNLNAYINLQKTVIHDIQFLISDRNHLEPTDNYMHHTS
jgi:hypothetical protein